MGVFHCWSVGLISEIRNEVERVMSFTEEKILIYREVDFSVTMEKEEVN